MVLRRTCLIHSAIRLPPVLPPNRIVRRCYITNFFNDPEVPEVDIPVANKYRLPGSDSMLTREQLALRTALDNLAQDLLDLSQYLAKASQAQKRLEKRHKLAVRDHSRSEPGKLKDAIGRRAESRRLKLQAAEEAILEARQKHIPDSGYLIRLKRLHGRLPYPQIPEYKSEVHLSEQLSMSHTRLKSLLSLPVPTLLEDLAHHLLTTSLPFSEQSFLIIMKRLSSFRYGSVARSTYFQYLSAGFAPATSEAFALFVKHTVSIRNKREFARLRRLLKDSDLPRDGYLYESLIVGCLKMGNPSQARLYLDDMVEHGFRPALQSLTYFLHDCGSRRRWDQGVDVWRSIKIGHAHAEFKIDVLAYHEMYRLCKKCHRPSSAKEILCEAEEQRFSPLHVIRRPRVRMSPIRPTNKTPRPFDYQNAYQAAYQAACHQLSSPRRDDLLDHVLGTFRPSNFEKTPTPCDPLQASRSFSHSRKRVRRMISKRVRNIVAFQIDIRDTLKEETAESLDIIPTNTDVAISHATEITIEYEHTSDTVQESTDSFLALTNADDVVTPPTTPLGYLSSTLTIPARYPSPLGRRLRSRFRAKR
jgi:pentatricopeptide repeat protein